ncbi:opioid growth factor receptor conserved region-domain-containing protein [Auriculariales sp. MPI-PUGE-AT-0066]|nr:opioid growth factor receptor conserved region-domain-containing protein [Auriculariales sp. MPI-PUGE-AT-0066]
MAAVPRDVQEFLDNYPGRVDDDKERANLDFYLGTGRCQPNALTIDELHEEWRGDYETLEFEHGYIQWLFPIPERGMNFRSQPLHSHEEKAMRTNPQVVARVQKSYQLMLDFYGMKLVDASTGLLERTDGYQPRYRNLVRSSHNYLRISRILKHLSIMGLEHLGTGLLLHFLSEQSANNTLNNEGLCSSMDHWWANCVRNAADRAWIAARVSGVRSGSERFSRAEYAAAVRRRKDTGSFAAE